MAVASVGTGAASARWFARSCSLDTGCAYDGPEPLDGRWWALAVLALLVAVFLQIAANYVDDAADGAAGRDDDRAAGAPARLVARGADPRKVMLAGTVFTAAAVIAGLSACALAGGSRWWLLVVGALCAALAWGYSAGPRPLSMGAWAPLAVVAVFGLAGVLGTQFLLVGSISIGGVLSALAQGCACAAVLLVNDIRDRRVDEVHGKITLAVRLQGSAHTVFALLAWTGSVILLLQALSMRAWPALVPALLGIAAAAWDPVRRAQSASSDAPEAGDPAPARAAAAWKRALAIMCLVPLVLMIGFWLVAARV